MRRRPGALLPLEWSILCTAVELVVAGEKEFHGYGIARAMNERGETRRLAAHGTLYRALERLEAAGFLESHWEDPEHAASERRPLRRLYRLTAAGARTARVAPTQQTPGARLQPGALEP